ncbi:MAG: VCBS repeat-containing protein [Saprospiraceae bacterium]|nr:VCBS repeat-containing protein [Saprospiraceae bacterium]
MKLFLDHNHRLYGIVLFCCMIFFINCNQDQSYSEKKKKDNPIDQIKLEQVLPSHSNIHFQNTIKENERLHAFIWNFIYQGAGVAIGDINNDGLPDLYFSGNMVSDKLYLNLGNLKFRDISGSSGIQDKLWSTGVTMVDINNDGLLDIYVCKNFFLLQRGVRANKLFINNGDLTFTESAKAYGIDDDGYSIQANFFDADNDKDLDMYLVNQPMDQYASMLANPETLKKLPFSDKLYRNDNGKFVDVTTDKKLANRSYGLSAITSDFNNDGQIDIYLCNDYDQGDQFYINQGNGDFINEISQRLNHTSYYSMGSDISDINNDGILDFITLDMAFGDHYRSKTNMKSMQPEKFWDLVEKGNYFQYPVNNLHLGYANGSYSEIGHFLNISHTDWSWSPLFVDLDLDSHNDLVISNGLLRDLRNNDFINTNLSSGNFSVNKHNFTEVLSRIPSTPISNFIYKNHGQLNFEDISTEAGFSQKGFSTGMAYGDLDKDGDMDLVINNTNAIASIFENKTADGPSNNFIKIKLKGPQENTSGIGAQIKVYFDNQVQSSTINNCRGYMSSSEMIAQTGLGKSNVVDSVTVQWNITESSLIKNPAINKTLVVDYKNSKDIRRIPQPKTKANQKQNLIDYTHKENAFNDYELQALLPHKLSQNGPFIKKGDLNGDNLEDVIVGGGPGQPSRVFFQSGGKFLFSNQPAFQKDKAYEDLDIALFDLENDGDLDIYIVSGGSQHLKSTGNNTDRLYLNDGKGTFTRSNQSLPFSNIDGQKVLIADFNKDGYSDVFIGGRSIPGQYPKGADSKLLINNEGKLEDMTKSLASDLLGLGMVTDACSGDFDNDGDTDLLVIGEWMGPTIFTNNNGQFTKSTVSNTNLTGWLWAIDKGDFDNDGDIDFIIGNLGLNNKFKASSKKPFQIFSGDLDQNGDHDVVLAKINSNQLVPLRGKECSTEELPFISEKFKTYDAFAKASLIDIYTEEVLDNALNITIENFEHFYLENSGKGQFEKVSLPREMQIGCIKDFIVKDFNNDGNLDFIYAGNHYPVEVETVRYDGNKGGIAIGSGDGTFTIVAPNKSGLYLDGDIRDLELLKVNNLTYILSTENNGKVKSNLFPKF